MSARWKVGDWAYKGYELVQIKEMEGDKVTEVTTGFFRSSCNDYNDRLFPQTLANKQAAEAIEIYWDRVRNARGGCMLNHPDLNRKFEDFAWQVMSLPEDESRKPVMDAALKFQQECSEKLREALFVNVGGVYVFNQNRPY